MTYTFITHLVLLCRRFGNKYGLTSTIGAFFIFVNKYPYFSIIGFYSHACKANGIFPNVNFANWYQPIILGIVAAIIGYLMEVAMLRENTNVMTLIADFVVSSAIVYFGAMFFMNSYVTFWGALLTGALLGVTEIFQHNWLLHSGRAKKEDTVSD